MPAAALSAFIAGWLFSLSLIVAIGPQNAFVLRQGAVRRHIGTVVSICIASEALLIAAGVAGAGAAVGGRHALLQAVRIGGAAVLIAYAFIAGRRAARPATAVPADAPASSAHAAVIGACLLFTWGNPTVYLETVVLLGSVANATHGERWPFGAGAVVASTLWFIALGFGARALAPLLRRPGAWRALDGLVAVVMTVTAARLLAGA